MDMWLKTFLGSAIIYAALVLAVYCFQRSLMYYPDKMRPDIAGSGMEEFSVTTAEGLSLTGWYKAPAAGKPVILWFHGNAQHHGARTEWAEPYIRQGYGILLAGYRGYG